MANEPIREVVVNGNTYPIGADTSAIEQQIEDLNNDLTKKSLVNTYYDSSVRKLYQVNADGTKGSEIKMGMYPDYGNVIHTFKGETTYTVPRDGFLVGAYQITSGSRPLGINNSYIAPSDVEAYVKKGDVIRFPIAIMSPNIGGGYGGLYLVGVLN